MAATAEDLRNRLQEADRGVRKTKTYIYYVLHAFQKKTPTTAKRDVELARKRYTDLMRDAE